MVYFSTNRYKVNEADQQPQLKIYKQIQKHITQY